MRKLILLLLCIPVFSIHAKAQDGIKPDETHLFAERDSISLYLDIYYPTQGSITSVDGKEKPTILYAFGGGFFTGTRSVPYQQKWYKLLNDNGYKVIALDYRLGMAGSKIGLNFLNDLRKSILYGVCDLFTATAYLLANADSFGIDKDNIVISGSSAGAIISLQAAYELSIRSEITAILPEDFNYAGVMSFSGAVFTSDGKPRYGDDVAPTLFIHGTKDKIVTYKQISFFKLHFCGSKALASIYEKNGLKYNIYRYRDRGHEMSIAMIACIDEELDFLENIVTRKIDKTIDAFIDDPSIEGVSWGKMSALKLYKTDSSETLDSTDY